jgi:hypothetical protein
MSKRTSVCLICHYPREVWLEFLSKITDYDVYLVIDDNSQNYQEKYHTQYPTLNFIQVDNEEYKAAGFIDVDFMEEIISGWHKSLYYFCIKHPAIYEHTWFFEDDVFFHSEETLRAIDIKHPDSDLLSNKFAVNDDGNASWHWYKVQTRYPLPWYNAMTCIVRMSRKCLDCIASYAAEHKTLFFIEAMFPTIAMKCDLICDSPNEFRNVYFRHEFNPVVLNGVDLYHPYKDYDLHKTLRDFIDTKVKYMTLLEQIKKRSS